MNPAAMPGMRQLAQIYDWFSGLSSSSLAISDGSKSSDGSKRRQMPLKVAQFCRVFSFLEPEEMYRLERVSKDFQGAVGIECFNRCQDFFLGADLDSVLKTSLGFKNFKELFQFMDKNIFDERFWNRYIGKVEPSSQIPKVNFLKKRNDPDPCDLTKTIGSEYVLMYLPEYVEINQSGVSLSKEDNPNDPEAPRLIREEASLGAQSKNTTLKVAVTLNNIMELFKHPKTGNPSTCLIWDEVDKEHGNTRTEAKWICMRRETFNKYCGFYDKFIRAREVGVIVSGLLPRLFFNFMEHSRSKEVGVYLDGRKRAITSAGLETQYEKLGYGMSFSKAKGNLFGLRVLSFGTYDYNNLGVAVELPNKVLVDDS